MRPLITFSVPLLLAGSAALAAQADPDSVPAHAPTPLCYHARPKPACSAFLLTTFGGYLLLGNNQLGDTRLREVADWGAMVNVSGSNAVGASVFASLDQAGFALGPAARYRHWFPSAAALEVALGTSLVTTSTNVQPGSLFGLVRYSPNDWFAVGVRPELLRQPTVFGCGATGCNVAVRSHARVSVGMEFGAVPGTVLTGVGGVAGFLLAALAASVD